MMKFKRHGLNNLALFLYSKIREIQNKIHIYAGKEK